MPKITPSPLIQSMSGKVCAHSDTYFATNKQTGKVYAARVCNPSTAEPTEKQMAVRSAFATRSANTKAWMSFNKPTESNPQGTAEYQTMLAKYKAQHKIGNFYAYVNKVINADTSASGTTNSGAHTSGGSTSGGSGAPNLE